jgi:protein TonB
VQLVSPPPAAQGTVGEVDFVPPRRIATRYVSPIQSRSGVVAISFVVDETGLPTNLVVVESAGPILDAAAIESVRTWRFEPARRGGVKVSAPLTSRHTYLQAR